MKTSVVIELATERGKRRALPDVTVNMDSLLTWLPAAELEALGVTREQTWRFVFPDGSEADRDLGDVILHVAEKATIDMVVFAERDDSVHLGWHTLSGLNVRIDPVRKELVDGGPVPAAPAHAAA